MTKQELLPVQTPTCPYCNGMSIKTTGESIYPHRPDLKHKMFYACKICDAYVGCHESTGKPLGQLANASLRKARVLAHYAFDWLWEDAETHNARGKAYGELAKLLGVSVMNCHIGMFSEKQCTMVIKICADQLITTASIERSYCDD